LTLQAGCIEVGNKHKTLGQKALATWTDAGPTFFVEIGERLPPIGSPPAKHHLLKTLSEVRLDFGRRGYEVLGNSASHRASPLLSPTGQRDEATNKSLRSGRQERSFSRHADYRNSVHVARLACNVQAEFKHEQTADRYAAGAVELLRRATAAGFRDLAQVRADPLLASLRERPDFKEWLKELEGKAKASGK